jgi:hypothetical protein
VRSGCQASTHCFSYLGWDQDGYDKKCPEISYAEVVFLHPVGSVGHIVHSGARNFDALFFILRWDRYESDKMRVRTSYIEIDLLHPVGYAGHVVHYCASGAQTLMHYFSCSCGTGRDLTKSTSGHVMPNLFFCILWDLRVTCGILVHLGCETSTHYFSCSGGTGTDLIKSALGHIMPNLCFCIQWDM